MNEITNNPYLNSLTLASRQEVEEKEQESSGNELGQTAFLDLMITQMENQDPLSPQDNTDFIAQLAQFSSVEGLERLNSNFDNFTNNFISNQALQASSLVGRSVSVPASQSELFENSVVGGVISLPASTTNMSMSIYSEQGALVDTIPLGSQASGDIVFRWDGKRVEINGELTDWQAEETVAPGRYSFEVIATQDGEPERLETALTANVNSVTTGENGQLVLNLSGVGAVNINDVKQFN